MTSRERTATRNAVQGRKCRKKSFTAIWSIPTFTLQTRRFVRDVEPMFHSVSASGLKRAKTCRVISIDIERQNPNSDPDFGHDFRFFGITESGSSESITVGFKPHRVHLRCDRNDILVMSPLTFPQVAVDSYNTSPSPRWFPSLLNNGTPYSWNFSNTFMTAGSMRGRTVSTEGEGG